MAHIKPDFTLGILGGGQLGRMSALAAARLGISVIIFCPEENSPASLVAKKTIIADYSNTDALKQFSELCDAISYEFENIPIETIEYLDSIKPYSVFPEKKLLLVSQDRIKEKQFLNALNIQTTQWAGISSLNDIKSTIKLWNTNGFILKTTRFGYDGKGQIKCASETFETDKKLSDFLNLVQNHDLIMESLVDFTCEVSVVVARDLKGNTETYGTMLNEHKNHILHKTTVPSNIALELEAKALSIAKTIADDVKLVGVLTVEFFICADGRVLVNEIAPRTHNSGHWSIDACAVSQFENHVRTVCGLPVGSTARHSDATLLNLIGDDIDTIESYLNAPNTCVHLYGKTEALTGRKMGHITFLKPHNNQPK